MKDRRNYSLAVGLLAAMILTITAAGWALPAPQLPTVDEVIARHVEAVGGGDAIMGHTSQSATGSMEIVGQGISGTLTIYAAAPNKTLLLVDFPDLGIESRTGFDGEVGWSIDPMMGQRLLAGGELQQLVDESDYYSDLHDPDKFSTMEVVEQTQFAGQETYKVRLVYKSGRESFEYFDVETGLLAGVEGVQESLMGSLNVVTIVEDYQQFGDLMLPTRLLQELGPGQSVQITLDSIEYDSVEASTFDLPAAIKALQQD